MSVPAPAYAAGDLSRMLFPSAPAPPVVDGKADASFFGYLKPVKGRPQSRKTPKGGGKFSQANLNAKIKEKKKLAQQVRQKHEAQVKADADRKTAAKAARANNGRPVAAAAADLPSDGEEDDGIDMDDGDAADDMDDEAIEDFMRDIENEDQVGAAEDADSDSEEPVQQEDKSREGVAAKAKADRLAKKEKRLAEDAEMEAPLPKKKDIKKQRKENLENDIRIPRTIFVGNVPTHLKASKLSKWLEAQLDIDSSVTQSIVESVRYRSVAVADPKLPKKVAIQKGLLHEDRDSLNAYVVFTEEKYVALAVAQANGKEIELDGKAWRLRVDTITAPKAAAAAKHDNAFTIFCGNLPFNVNENDLYAHFDDCGAIENVRIVRDRETNMGKGISFITFKDAQSVRNALASHGSKFQDRELRIMKAVENKKLHQVAVPKADAKKAGGGGSTSGKKGAPGSARKEGYGGVGKVKEVNQAGVLKKPRHVPRTGASDPVKKTPSVKKTQLVAGANAKPRPEKGGVKRSFEGDHADPTAHVKKQKVEDFKQREKKEKRKEQKKLGATPTASKKKD